MNQTFSYYGILLLALMFVTQKECSKQQVVEDCYKERKTVRNVKALTGQIKKHGKNWLIISNENPSKHYSPCNIPLSVQHLDMSVEFSGYEKEVYPNERWAGAPFVITSINKKTS